MRSRTDRMNSPCAVKPTVPAARRCPATLSDRNTKSLAARSPNAEAMQAPSIAALSNAINGQRQHCFHTRPPCSHEKLRPARPVKMASAQINRARADNMPTWPERAGLHTMAEIPQTKNLPEPCTYSKRPPALNPRTTRRSPTSLGGATTACNLDLAVKKKEYLPMALRGLPGREVAGPRLAKCSEVPGKAT